MRTGIKVGRCCLLAAAVTAAFSEGAFAQITTQAKVPVVVVNVAANVALAPITGVSGTGASGSVAANAQQEFSIMLSTDYTPAPAGVSYLRSGRASAGVQAKYSRGNVTLNLPAQSYKNAVISLYSVNGRRVLSGSASASKAQTFSISRFNVPAGVYLLAVRGPDGNSFATRLTHSGDRLNINAAFAGMDNAELNKSAVVSEYGKWTITVSAEGYHPEVRTFEPLPGTNPVESFTLRRPAQNSRANFTDTVAGSNNSKVPVDMIYIPGGTFTIGCEAASGCPADTKPVSGVKVSSYYISKTEVSTALWNAVMGTICSGYGCPSGSSSYTSMTWYDAMEFACKLSQKTGRNYRMTTEAEWEYAAKNYRSSLEKIGGGSGVGGEEWAYNSWLATHDTVKNDPVGPSSGLYTQKTRRDANTGGDNITARLIRSIDGIGPALRLAVSADADYPPTYVPPCYLHRPELGPEPENSYRDLRWVTGSAARWTTGSIAIGPFDLRVWDDGTARLNNANGQWFTSNNIAFVFVPSSGSRTKFAYIFLDKSQGSLISDKSSCYYNCDGASGYVGRIMKEAASNYAKPTISGLKSGAELAAAAGDDYKMVDMANIPSTARQQDQRLLDGTNMGWFQDNRQAGGVHHYRKDIDTDEFRFTVNQLPSSSTILANGSWFTVNNIFLRVTHSTGYTADYLYALTSDGTFYHNSFMGYERGDFRMFKKTANAPANDTLWRTTCGNLCSGEIQKGQNVSFYATDKEKGQSTFTPAPCPAGGCK